MSKPIGFTNPDDVGYDVFLLAGQSNMAGEGTAIDTTNYDVSDPRVWQFGNTGPRASTIALATEPLNVPTQPPIYLGPALAFARAYLRMLPANRKVLLVPMAVGGTSFGRVQPNWLPPSGTYYVNAVAQANAAMAAALNEHPASRLAGFLWHQGEFDVPATYTTYAGWLDTFIAALRANVTGATASTPFVCGQMVPDWYPANDTGAGGGINTAHVQAPARNSFVGFAKSAGIGMSDPVAGTVHYNAVAQRIMGRRFLDGLRLARANDANVAPTAPKAPSLVQQGTSLVVVINRPLCRITGLSVQYRVAGAGGWTTFNSGTSIDTGVLTDPSSPQAGGPIGGQVITGLMLGTSYDVQVAVVNEQGTSSYSPIVTLAMLNLPAQVTGLATGTATPSTMPLTWTATPTATSYQVQYKAHSSGVWLNGPLVTTNAATVTLLLSATSYDFQVAAINAAGTGTYSATATTPTATPTPLIDAVTAAGGASPWRSYGLRKMLSTYAGSAIRVRRSSDSTTQDIGFTAGGDLDQAALLTFCGAGSGYVNILYDQSGNARNLTQATAANQPQIVNAGVVNTVGGHPTMLWGTSVFTDAIAGMYAAGASTGIGVCSTTIPAGATDPVLVMETDAAGGLYEPVHIPSAASVAWFTLRNDALTVVAQLSGASSIWTNGGATCTSWVDAGNAFSAWRNGIVAQSNVAYTRSGTLAANLFVLGAIASNAAHAWIGNISEMTLWTSALGTAARVAGEGNANNYYTLA